MNAICTYENIRGAIKAVEGMVGKELNIPIIQNILIEAKENSLSLSATNLEIGVVQKIPAKTEGEWKIVIAPGLLTGFLNAIRGGEHITLEKDDTTLLVKTDSYQSEIKGFDAEEYPIIPYDESGDGVTLKLGVLKSIVSSVVSFVTHNEIRPELTGVYLTVRDGQVFAAATDSFRLGERKGYVKDLLGIQGELPDMQVILPQKICNFIIRLPEDNEDVVWHVKDNHLSITSDGLYVTTRLIDGNYPDYTQIIPTKTETNVIIKKADLIESMKVMMVFSQKEASEVVMSVTEDSVDVSTRKQEHGSSVTKLSASISGGEQEFVVNPRYVYEGVQNISEDEVFIGVNNDAAPILFRGSSKEGINELYTYIVMPIKNN